MSVDFQDPRRRTRRGGSDPRVRKALQESESAAAYVEETWRRLKRDLSSLYLPGGIADPKMPPPADNHYRLYISPDEDIDRVREELKHARRLAAQHGGEDRMPVIEPVRLAPGAELKLEEHGLLYVPRPYIVPGERYNEMYNWDSIFIGRGLIAGGHFDDAKHLVDNLLYESEHYGTILNGNRTYYLDSRKSRSQPPLVTDYMLTIFDNWDKLKHAEYHEPGARAAWLKNAAERMEEYYRHWVTPPHGEEGGLSRYDSFRRTPSDEVAYCEKGHYEGALARLQRMAERQRGRKEPLTARDREERYYVEQFLTQAGELSPAYYRGDTAMRESGFDPSERFGFYNADIFNHLPVCLNALRLKMEKDMTSICQRLEGCDEAHAQHWQETRTRWERRAEATQRLINEVLWDPGEKEGPARRSPCYRDRNTNRELREKHGIPEFRDYNFATALFPLWAGAASQKQADEVIAHVMQSLRTPYGLGTSDRETGSQWDKPLLWAPLQVVAVEALERYGHYDEALDIATGYITAVSKDFAQTGKLWEKYESHTGSSRIREHIDKGYFVNDEGFGWTNAAVIELRAAIKRLDVKMQQEQRRETPHSRIMGSGEAGDSPFPPAPR